MDDAFATWLRRRSVGSTGGDLTGLYELVARSRGVTVEQLTHGEREQIWARALPVMDPGYEVIPNSERPEPEEVELVPYNPHWPEQFLAWEERLLAVLEPGPRIEHIGSTSVPGLPAKPVIDILIMVRDMRDETAYVPAIESLGVQFRMRDHQHRYFRPFSGRPRDVQIHVCNAGSQWEQRHLLLRDYLRADARARDVYLRAKQEAAARWKDDRIAYADAKTEVIDQLLAKARTYLVK